MSEARAGLKRILSSPRARLSSLYWQVDKRGRKFKFSPNPIQEDLYRRMWYLNVVLKARQEGVTTLTQLFMLDRCLFNPNTRAGVIAHNREDAENFFKHKIKFAYDNLPAAIKQAIPAKTERAAEIVSGSLNTVVPGQFIIIESTAEGAYGKYYDLCQTAEKKMLRGEPLTEMDYRFHFFPWHRMAEYRLDAPGLVIPKETLEYFRMLELDHGVVLDEQQRAWYVKKAEEQGEHMFREYPSTPEDAFRAVVEGAVFGKQMRKARTEGRVVKSIPYIEGIPVNTFWDLGRNDSTVIWFHQRVGAENRFIDYIEDSGHNMQHYIRMLLQEKPYLYGKHYMPHDIEVVEYTNSENKSRKEVAQQAGLRNIVTVPRIQNKEDAHDMGRQALATCVFAENDGVKALENYRYEWDEKRQQWSKTPVDNRWCHGADGYMQFAQHYNPNAGSSSGGGHVGMF